MLRKYISLLPLLLIFTSTIAQVDFGQARSFMKKRCSNVNMSYEDGFSMDYDGSILHVFLVSQGSSYCVSTVSQYQLDVMASKCGGYGKRSEFYDMKESYSIRNNYNEQTEEKTKANPKSQSIQPDASDIAKLYDALQNGEEFEIPGTSKGCIYLSKNRIKQNYKSCYDDYTLKYRINQIIFKNDEIRMDVTMSYYGTSSKYYAVLDFYNNKLRFSVGETMSNLAQKDYYNLSKIKSKLDAIEQRKAEREKKDFEMRDRILSLISNQNVEEAVELYEDLSEARKQEVKNDLAKAFKNKYADVVIKLNKDAAQEIIEKNKSEFSNLNVGLNNITIGIDGQTKGLSSDVSLDPYVYKKGGFECKRPCEFLIDIKEVSDYQLSVNSYYESGKISDETSALASMVGTKNYYWFIADDKKGERVIVRSYKDYPKSKYTNYTQIENVLYRGSCSNVIEVKLVTITKTTANGIILKEDRNVSDCIKSKS